MSNIFGKYFCLSTFGESHGSAVGVVIDGCPAGIDISLENLQYELDRRKPGQSVITTSRKEDDTIEILSGIFEGKTLGTPITLLVRNEDFRPKAYQHMKELYRPSHADYTYEQRYGYRDWRGGGRASNRESVARVAAGAIAKELIAELCNIEVLAWVAKIRNIETSIKREAVTKELIEKNIVRCPEQTIAEQMIEAIKTAKKTGDSLGGVIHFLIRNTPAGIGSPVFKKLHSEIGKALLSINATRAFEIGLGYDSTVLTGSEHNDEINITEHGEVTTTTNNAGGIVGGISNGEDIYGSLAFKPTATIIKKQHTISTNKENIIFSGTGRHDPCVLPRAVPIVEAMINLVLADQLISYTFADINRLKKIFAK